VNKADLNQPFYGCILGKKRKQATRQTKDFSAAVGKLTQYVSIFLRHLNIGNRTYQCHMYNSHSDVYGMQVF
jgi:hypothetical protein